MDNMDGMDDQDPDLANPGATLQQLWQQVPDIGKLQDEALKTGDFSKVDEATATINRLKDVTDRLAKKHGVPAGAPPEQAQAGPPATPPALAPQVAPIPSLQEKPPVVVNVVNGPKPPETLAPSIHQEALARSSGLGPSSGGPEPVVKEPNFLAAQKLHQELQDVEDRATGRATGDSEPYESTGPLGTEQDRLKDEIEKLRDTKSVKRNAIKEANEVRTKVGIPLLDKNGQPVEPPPALELPKKPGLLLAAPSPAKTLPEAGSNLASGIMTMLSERNFGWLSDADKDFKNRILEVDLKDPDYTNKILAIANDPALNINDPDVKALKRRAIELGAKDPTVVGASGLLPTTAEGLYGVKKPAALAAEEDDEDKPLTIPAPAPAPGPKVTPVPDPGTGKPLKNPFEKFLDNNGDIDIKKMMSEIRTALPPVDFKDFKTRVQQELGDRPKANIWTFIGSFLAGLGRSEMGMKLANQWHDEAMAWDAAKARIGQEMNTKADSNMQTASALLGQMAHAYTAQQNLQVGLQKFAAGQENMATRQKAGFEHADIAQQRALDAKKDLFTQAILNNNAYKNLTFLQKQKVDEANMAYKRGELDARNYANTLRTIGLPLQMIGLGVSAYTGIGRLGMAAEKLAQGQMLTMARNAAGDATEATDKAILQWLGEQGYNQK